jgi:hypothetical protein
MIAVVEVEFVAARRESKVREDVFPIRFAPGLFVDEEILAGFILDRPEDFFCGNSFRPILPPPVPRNR